MKLEDMKMRIIEYVKTLIDRYKDFRTLTEDDLADFYQSKCDYYQQYVGVSLVVGTMFSSLYIVSDYLLGGGGMPTLIPRLSVLGVLIIYLIALNFCQNRASTVLADHIMAHYMVLATMWAVYYLDDRLNVGQVFIIMGLVVFTIGFVSMPREFILTAILFLLEIVISNIFIHYKHMYVIIALQIPCIFAIIASHILLNLLYLDYYRGRQKLELASITDPLTQVYNRHLLEKIVSKNALNDIKGPVAIAMLDIDYFKQVNDEHGHYTGDLTLLYIGQKLSRETHPDDYVIRFGGEEFIVIFKNCDINNACARMEQFRQDIEKAEDSPVHFTISVGLSMYTGDFSKTIQNVDHALTKAKNTGRNKVVVVFFLF